MKGVGIRVQGSGFRVQGSGFGVVIQGYLAHKEMSLPKDHHRAIGMGLL